MLIPSAETGCQATASCGPSSGAVGGTGKSFGTAHTFCQRVVSSSRLAHLGFPFDHLRAPSVDIPLLCFLTPHTTAKTDRPRPRVAPLYRSSSDDWMSRICDSAFRFRSGGVSASELFRTGFVPGAPARSLSNRPPYLPSFDCHCQEESTFLPSSMPFYCLLIGISGSRSQGAWNG